MPTTKLQCEFYPMKYLLFMFMFCIYFFKKEFYWLFFCILQRTNTVQSILQFITSHRNIDDRLHGWLWIERRYLNVNISNVIIQILIL